MNEQQTTDKKMTGAVMVVGGGISGMQSSLDLAEAGYSVYLVEKKPAIGGTMARLDKTFPTNDCAMCIMSPKLVDTGRHKDINIIAGAEVLDVTGEPGNFKVKLHKKARYVELAKCTGCGECATVCPVELKDQFNGELASRKAIYKLYAQATPNAFAVEKRGVAPCTAACPAGINVQGYVQLIKSGKFIEAWKMIYRDNPLPAICGRVCAHPCESACNRKDIDQTVQIQKLKRLASDIAYENMDSLPLPEKEGEREERVAVIGSGPAGLTAAHYLALKGYKVTIFEALPVSGGMMRVGIPEYRLPKKWVDLEVQLIERLGVEIKYNTALGKDITIDQLFSDGYKAIFLAVGAHKGIKMRTPGDDLDGVVEAVSMLRKFNLGEKVNLGRKVLVVGGGNVAMDAARSAVRLGAEEVHVLYRRTREEMPAADEEVEEAMEEGVKFHFRTVIKEIKGKNGKVNEVVTQSVVAMVKNEQGRWVPQFGDEVTKWDNVDTVIAAIGQSPDLSFVGDKPLANQWGNRIEADPDTLATNVPGIFAGGDVQTGPALLIDAIGAGKRAAESIHRYIQGEDLRANRQFKVPEEKISPLRQKADEVEVQAAVPMNYADPAERAKDLREVALGYTAEQAQQEAERCLNCAVCSDCLQCVDVCVAKAIDHSMVDEEVEIDVGAVILSPGFETFDAANLEYYRYNEYPNVITSIQFERILSASGPYEGHMVRPSDSKEPKKIAWIQCVGSRNEKQCKGYCSSVCCMYAIKQCVIAKEHSRDPLETDIFFMDMRTHGKDFERYYDRARNEHGVNFIRSRIYEIQEANDGSNDLIIRYSNEDGSITTQRYDLVVLSVGLSPNSDAVKLAEAAGIELNDYGFCLTDEFTPGCTSRPGIYVGGAFCEPKDIPETAVDASSAAAHASRLLAPVRGTMIKTQEYPPERDVTGEEPRVGVFVCNCGINIGSVVKVPEVVEYARGLDNVVYAEEFLFSCSADNIAKIKEAIVEQNLNRVVVSSCTPRTHAPLFQASLREAGINPYLYEHANIREHVSWVHRDQPERATEKAKDLVKMAVAKVKLLKPVQTSVIDINRRALVVGGGVAGMSNALSLAEQGFAVTLVEKTGELGGHARHIHYTINGNNPVALVEDLVAKVTGNDKIDLVLNAQVSEVSGYLGNYRTLLKLDDGSTVEVEHGAVVIATGAEAVVPNEYLYGEHPAVLTQQQLEEKIVNSQLNAKTYVMIQCVGSRQDDRPYCSRICCTQAVKNALKIKEQQPDARIFVLYRDIRTYGFKEKYYTKARQQGVIFIRYSLDDKPQVTAKGDQVSVLVTDPVLGQPISIDADLLVLSSGIEPKKDNEVLSQHFKVPLTTDGFFSEAHMKLRPVDFAADGLYLCGLAHGPKTIDESIAQANAAAVRAVTLLSKPGLESLGITATVDEELCRGCGLCVEVCPYSARVLDERTKVAWVREVLCQGCGACVAVCPSGACQQKGFEKDQMLSMMDAVLG
ncbi:NAD(P)-binding protein [Desulfofalx alkaliphila]|uniref:NAD(P)-binding protein n=1 Tax=Desulfofalx alkaliphila TaxID=105483 RepID=UPI0004E10E9B|nr:NAD(P)-binding protein [Desulfofalx alkaliphila]